MGRVVLAAFCLTWLQLAALPCVMALDAQPAAMQMPAGMQMAPGEHCPYCPPAQAPDPANCQYPHDPQVDSRVGLASVLLAPAPVAVFAAVPEANDGTLAAATVDAPPVLPGTPLAVSYCRYLK